MIVESKNEQTDFTTSDSVFFLFLPLETTIVLSPYVTVLFILFNLQFHIVSLVVLYLPRNLDSIGTSCPLPPPRRLLGPAEGDAQAGL